MGRLGIIAAREFLERVRSRSFWIGCLIVPLGFGASALAGQWAQRAEAQPVSLGVVSAAPQSFTARFIRHLEGSAAPEAGTPRAGFEVERLPGEPDREPAAARALAEALDGWVRVPADVLETQRVELNTRTPTLRRIEPDLRRALSAAIVEQRLTGAGAPRAVLDALETRAQVKLSLLDDSGRAEARAVRQVALIRAIVVAILLYFTVAFHGNRVLQSILEEKGSRIPDVLLTSVRATQLLGGKILGAGASTALQLAIWLVAVVGNGLWSGEGERGVSLAWAVLSVDPASGAVMALILACGFLLASGLYAALGACARTRAEATPASTLIALALISPLFFLETLLESPSDPLSRALSLFPITATVAMPARMVLGAVPPAELVLSIGLLASTAVLALWAAARVYHDGILNCGRGVTLLPLSRLRRGGRAPAPECRRA